MRRGTATQNERNHQPAIDLASGAVAEHGPRVMLGL
jgi:hypothetical protein